jgi:short-subunit dehydrogenase
VNVASLAGRLGLPGLETYGAAKAGLANFTAALRASYRGRGVSASAVLPGFVHGSGMYQRFQDGTGLPTPRLMGSSSVRRVVRAVLRAVRSDLAEVVVNPVPVRPLLAVQALWPGLAERLVGAAGGDWYLRAGLLAHDLETRGERQGQARRQGEEQAQGSSLR